MQTMYNFIEKKKNKLDYEFQMKTNSNHLKWSTTKKKNIQIHMNN